MNIAMKKCPSVYNESECRMFNQVVEKIEEIEKNHPEYIEILECE